MGLAPAKVRVSTLGEAGTRLAPAATDNPDPADALGSTLRLTADMRGGEARQTRRGGGRRGGGGRAAQARRGNGKRGLQTNNRQARAPKTLAATDQSTDMNILDLNSLGFSGRTLNLEERAGLEVAISKRKLEDGLTEALFWGKLYGDEDDYLIVFGFGDSVDFPVKQFYFRCVCDVNCHPMRARLSVCTCLGP